MNEAERPSYWPLETPLNEAFTLWLAENFHKEGKSWPAAIAEALSSNAAALLEPLLYKSSSAERPVLGGYVYTLAQIALYEKFIGTGQKFPPEVVAKCNEIDPQRTTIDSVAEYLKDARFAEELKKDHSGVGLLKATLAARLNARTARQPQLKALIDAGKIKNYRDVGNPIYLGIVHPALFGSARAIIDFEIITQKVAELTANPSASA